MITERDVIFHIDMGCSEYVVTQRLLQDPDCAGSSKEEIKQFIEKMIIENHLFVKSKHNNDQFLVCHL